MLQHTRCAALLLSVIALPATARAQGSFEGSVTYQVSTAGGRNIEMTHHVKGSDVRMDMSMSGQSISVLTDIEGEKQIVLMHQPKQWMDAKAMQARMGMSVPGRMNADEAARAVAGLEIQATGEKETIAGVECEHYRMTSDGTEVDFCAAKGMGWYLTSVAGNTLSGMGGNRAGPQGIPGMSAAQLEQWKKMFADGFFPLKVTVTGSSNMTMVVTNLERKQLEASLFKTPADYNEMRIGG